MVTAEPTRQIGFGGGCHWCTEAVFQQFAGVRDVAQGFIASHPPDDSFSEAVRLRFDPTEVPLRVLISAHLATHASASDHAMRGKYRSAIYTTSDAQTREARDLLRALAAETGLGVVTRVLPLVRFRASDARFHDYYASDPERPFCRTYIDPKIAKLRAGFAPYLRSSAPIIDR